MKMLAKMKEVVALEAIVSALFLPPLGADGTSALCVIGFAGR